MKKLFICLVLALAACSAPPPKTSPQDLSSTVQASSNTSLCIQYQSAGTSLLQKQMIEAELAARGIQECGGSIYGRSSAAALGKQLYARLANSTAPLADTDEFKCSDFISGATAQRFFLAAGGPINDPHNLDGDGDGLACEWGTEIREIVASYRPPTPVRTYVPRRPRCYVGPRGGTYTITASGNRNYSGC